LLYYWFFTFVEAFMICEEYTWSIIICIKYYTKPVHLMLHKPKL